MNRLTKVELDPGEILQDISTVGSSGSEQHDGGHDGVAESTPVVEDQNTPQGAVCSLSRTQQQVEENLKRLLSDLPADPVAAEAHAAVELKLRPQPELMRAITLLAHPSQSQPLRTEMLRKLVLLRLLVNTHLRNLTSSSCIQPAAVEAVTHATSTLIELANALRHEFGTQVLELQHRDAQQFNGLLRGLMPASDRLHSYGLLSSMLEPMARAASEGTIHQVPHLKKREAELFASAVRPDHERGPAGRVVLDTLALRCAMQADLEAWQALPEPEAGATSAPDGATGEAADSIPLPVGHARILERLRLDMAIYNVLLERIQYQQSATLAQGDKIAFDSISSAQRLLFSVYSQVARVVREPRPEKKKRDGEVESALELLFDEAADAEHELASQPSEEEVYLEALTEMRDAEKGQPAASISAGVDPRRIRRRRRRRLLMATAAVLAVLAGAVNYLLYEPSTTAPPPALGSFAPAMPLDVATPMGPVMYAEIPVFNWNAMSVVEREKRVTLLGQLARDKGFDAVLLVDESKIDLARWTAADGVTLAPASAVPTD